VTLEGPRQLLGVSDFVYSAPGLFKSRSSGLHHMLETRLHDWDVIVNRDTGFMILRCEIRALFSET